MQYHQHNALKLFEEIPQPLFISILHLFQATNIAFMRSQVQILQMPTISVLSRSIRSFALAPADPSLSRIQSLKQIKIKPYHNNTMSEFQCPALTRFFLC